MPTSDEFRQAVIEAAVIATREVTKVYRRVLYAGLGALLATALLALVVTGVWNHHNCSNITALATVSEEESAEGSAATARFESRSKDRFGLSQRDFDKLIKEGQERRARHLATLRAIAHGNCTIP
jgi:type VI protein secretion system component VasK